MSESDIDDPSLRLSEDEGDKSRENSNLHVRPSISKDDNIDQHDEGASQSKRKTRGKNKEYEMLSKYSDYILALDSMNDVNEQNYSKRDTKESLNGDKVYFTCFNYPRCPKNAYILRHCDSQEASIWVCTSFEHDHLENKKGRLPQKTVDLVTNLVGEGFTGNGYILSKLKAAKCQISKEQLNNLKARLKKNTLGAASPTLDELKIWCDARMDIPDDLDQVFCGGIDYAIDDNDEITYLRIFVTTKRLIQFTKYNNHIATDGTYKLNYNQYPILMIGTTDFKRQFHPFGLMLTKNETSEDFAYMFSTIKKLSEAINEFDFGYNPTILLADAASAITKGFESVFKLEKRVFCWAHVLRAIDKELNKIKNKKIVERIRGDIVEFHHYVEDDSFYIVARLMILSWQESYENNVDIDHFISYFQKQWISPKRKGWFDHYCDWVPVTNNALESTNRYVKDKGTLRQRLAINQFLKLLETGFLKEWSIERDQIDNINCKKYEQVPIITLKDYTTASQWNRLGKTIKKYKSSKGFVYCAPSSDKIKEITTSDCYNYFLKIENQSWKSYHEFLRFALCQIRYVYLDEYNWKLSRCSCSYWCKYYTCKHMLSICERANKFDFPPEAKSIPIGMNRKRGRPRKTVSALKYQPDEHQEEYVYSDSDSDNEEDLLPKKKGRKRKNRAVESESEDEFDLFNDDHVKKASKNSISDTASSSSQVMEVVPSIQSRQKSIQSIQPSEETQAKDTTIKSLPKVNQTDQRKRQKKDIQEAVEPAATSSVKAKKTTTKKPTKNPVTVTNSNSRGRGRPRKDE